MPSKKLACNKYMMITSRLSIFLCFCYHLSFSFLVLCIFKSPVFIISTEIDTRWDDTSYICAFVKKSFSGFEQLCFLYFDFIKHTIYLNSLPYSKSQNLNLGVGIAYLWQYMKCHPIRFSLSKNNRSFCPKCKHVAFYPFKFTIHVFEVTSEKEEFSSVSLEERNRERKWIAKFNKNTK